MSNIKPPIGKQKIIVIVGPTASGKSNLALRLAKWFRSGRIAKQFGVNGAEIISADSRQVYRGMDIGTGKVPKDSFLISQFSIFNFQSNPKSKILKRDYCSGGIRHHLIDVVSPKKQFTADDFKRLGQKAIVDITSRSKIPIIVGGTGFYVDVLLGRMSVAKVPPNPKLRIKLEKQSIEQLYSRLLSMDYRRALTIEPKNKRRLIRALEIVLTTGKPVPKSVLSIKYKVLWLGLKPKNLEKRIKKRLDARLISASAKLDLATTGKEGMIKEVEQLHKKGVSWKRLDDFGLEYRWISRYLRVNRRLTIDYRHFVKSEFYEKLFKEIIKYSKRQMTWFKKNKEIAWISNIKQAHSLVQEFIH